MTRFTRKLLSECRNHAFVRFGKMSPAARLALMDMRSSWVVEYYGAGGWHIAAADHPMTEGVAYRVKPSFRPLSVALCGAARMHMKTGAR